MLTDAMHEHPPSALVRAELDRILASEIFSRSDRLSAFLKFIVERTLDGQGDSLKELVIALELYSKGSDFSTAADPIVRVDARRLRDRLREYYASASPASVVITVPKGSYTPVFTVGGDATGQRSHLDVRSRWPAAHRPPACWGSVAPPSVSRLPPRGLSATGVLGPTPSLPCGCSR